MTRWFVSVVPVVVFACGKSPPQGQTVDPKQATSSTATPRDEPLKGPAPEIVVSSTKVDRPAVPSFELPPSEPGFVSPRKLRVDGKKLLDTEIVVKGYVTFAYDCMTAIRQPNQTEAQVKKQIENDPSVCERPKFYLGDAPDTPPERSVWVVSVPRPPYLIEKQRLPKDELANWPKVPKYAVGDVVAVTGTFTLQSPHGERNSDGLIVFGKLEPTTPPPPAPPSTATPPTSQPPAPATKPAGPRPDPNASGKPVDPADRSASIDASNAGTKALGNKQWDTAIERFQKATDAWRDNHVAWYGMAKAHAAKRDWKRAREAAETAIVGAPDEPMYHLAYGHALYEAAVDGARDDLARKQNVRPDEVTPDMSVVNLEKPLLHLQQAVALEPRLWRAHYLVGRIYRDQGKSRPAAEALSAAIESGPPEGSPYVALAELYRTWDYTDEAIKVATAGTATVPGIDRAEVWLALAYAYADKLALDKAIEAATKALDDRRDLDRARLLRGRLYFQRGDFPMAKRDLEEALKSRGVSTFDKQTASRMLMEIVSKRP